MKKITFVLTISLSLLFTSQCLAQVDNFNHYYYFTMNSKIASIENQDYRTALNHYQKAFTKVKIPHLKDLVDASECAFRAGDTLTHLSLYKRAILTGGYKDVQAYISKNRKFCYECEDFKEINKKYKNLKEKDYIGQYVSLKLKREIEGIYTNILKKESEAQKAKNISILRDFLKDSVMSRLAEIKHSRGYLPGQQLTGEGKYLAKVLMYLAEYGLLAEDNFLLKRLNLFKEVYYGNISMEFYAKIYDYALILLGKQPYFNSIPKIDEKTGKVLGFYARNAHKISTEGLSDMRQAFYLPPLRTYAKELGMSGVKFIPLSDFKKKF